MAQRSLCCTVKVNILWLLSVLSLCFSTWEILSPVKSISSLTATTWNKDYFVLGFHNCQFVVILFLPLRYDYSGCHWHCYDNHHCYTHWYVLLYSFVTTCIIISLIYCCYYMNTNDYLLYNVHFMLQLIWYLYLHNYLLRCKIDVNWLCCWINKMKIFSYLNIVKQ